MIELMIVVAIIGILAAIAVPAYQDYIARSQISEAVSLLASAKTPFGEYYANEGRWPVLADDVMASTRGRYTSTITITQNAGAATGMVEVTANMNSAGINNQIVGKTVRLVSSDARSWSCLPGAVNGADPLYLPASCRN